ncbi:MAG: phage tail sheath C-terminal domain-containing protein [Polyangiaceae bacterium]
MANLISPPLTYPGVYVVELPKAGAQGVTPAPTAITAFLGRAVMGPVNTPVSIGSWAEFQQFFGGQASGYTMPRAVQDFFNNGGSQALIVRLVDLYPASVPSPSPNVMIGDSAVIVAATTAAGESGADKPKVKAAVETALAALEGKPLEAATEVAGPDSAMMKMLSDQTSTLPEAIAAGVATYVWKAVLSGASEAPRLTSTQQGAVVKGADLVVSSGSAGSSLLAMSKVLVTLAAALDPTAGAVSRVRLPIETQVAAVVTRAARTNPYLLGLAAVLAAMGAAWDAAKGPDVILAAAKSVAASLDGDALEGASALAFDPSLGGNTAQDLMASVKTAYDALVVNATISDRAWLAVRLAPSKSVFELVGKLVAGSDEAATKAVERAAAALGSVGNSITALLDVVSPDPVPLELVASSVGSWGNSMGSVTGTGVSVTYSLPEDIPAEVLAAINASAPPGVTVEKKDLFNLTVKLFPPGGTTEAVETFSNVTLIPDTSASLATILRDQSQYVRFASGPTKSRPEPLGPVAFLDGKDSKALSDNDYVGSQLDRNGLYALDVAETFNILCIPPDTSAGDISLPVWQKALSYVATNRAFLIIDPPAGWKSVVETKGIGALRQEAQTYITTLGGGTDQRFAMLYFPRLDEVNVLTNKVDTFVGCGAIAGLFARTDVARGVWKAPAGTNATLNQIAGLELRLDDAQNGALNPVAVNCLRTFPIYGSVVWGSRTVRGSSQLNDEYTYVSVRRLANFIEDSIQNSTKWAVFEPNDATLWGSLKQQITGFMNGLKNQGAFYNYFVDVGATTTSPEDIARGVVNVQIGFAPVQPAEFVILYFQQTTATTS